MVRKAARLTFPKIELDFHSEHSQYKITNDSSNDIGIGVGQNPGVLSNALVQFQTQNPVADNIGSFSIIVSGQSIRWDKILNSNDIIIIRIAPNEVEAAQSVYNTNIFTGLVSEIAIIGQYGSNSLMFQVSGQSFAKAFMQYKIGLISQLQQLVSNMGWLWDMNAELDAMTSGGGGDGKVSNISSGDMKKNALSIAKYLKKNVPGATNNAIAGLLGNWQQESGLNPASIEQPSGAGHGLSQWTGGRWTLLNAYAKKHHKNWTDLGLQLSFALNGDGTDSSLLKSLLKKKGSVEELTNEIQIKYERAGSAKMSNRISYAKAWSKYINKKLGADTGGSFGSGSGGGAIGDSGDSSSDSSGEVNSTADQIAKEEANSVGVAFFGNTVATIEKNIVNRFKPYMVYSYDNGQHKLWDFIDYSNMESWTDYEYLFDSSQFTNASGSLWDLMQNALRIPFNEMFFDSTADGKSKLVVRRTPFNPEDWQNLTQITVDSNDVIDNEVSKTDAQEFSVFVVNPATPTILGIANGMLLSAYPQTNQQLINYYGYSKYEVDDLYLSGRTNDNNKTSSKKSKGKGTKTDNTSGVFYDEQDVASFLSVISDNSLRLNKAKYAIQLSDAANNISNAQAYDLINSYCANGYQMTNQIYESVLQTDSGGGLSNTGTKDASYDNMEDCIERSGGDIATFMSVAKSTIKDITDEFLREVWQARESNGKLTKKGYKKVYDNYRKAGNAVGDSGATDLKVFTRMLYNWYADNFNFWGGTIIVSGNPDIRAGCILNVIDFYNKKQYGYPGMRYYIESVTHKFSYTEGYTTEIGVTRGMRMPVGNEVDPRFCNLWGTSIDFKGGYMGEAAISDLALAESSSDSASGTDDSDAFGGAKGNEIAVKAAEFGYSFRKNGSPRINGKKMKEVYSLGHVTERGSKNPLTHDLNQGTIVLDCSSFVYWCFRHFGAVIGTNTTTQANGSQFKKVNVGQSAKNMKVGDLVFMENCGHVMFYIGDGKLMGWNGSGSWDTSGGCQVQSLETVKSWANGIDGYVARFK